MCNQSARDIVNQHFGFQISEYITGLSQIQKGLNQFERAVYFPTNWRDSGYTQLRSKYPEFLRYGGLQPVNPEWFQRNFQGVYSLKEQPIVDEPQAFTVARYS